MKRPLVTFFVIAYAQERFIRQAVESALKQTYTPLEIVLSDDCSPDRTFEIICEVVKDYSGPHKVVLNRNERNLGLAEHLNRIMEIASGELTIAADGDDISSPLRTERCVEEWLKHGKPVVLVSSISPIDIDGKQQADLDCWNRWLFPTEGETPSDCLVRFSKQGMPRMISCSGAWTKATFEAFGPLPQNAWNEDDVITFRAWILDRVVFFPDYLVSYRQHNSNLHNRTLPDLGSPHARQSHEKWVQSQAERRQGTVRALLCDLDLAISHGRVTRALYKKVRNNLERNLHYYQLIERWWKVSWMERVSMFSVFFWHAPDLWRFPHVVRWCSPRLLPFTLFLALGSTWSRLRR